jgi:cystathionine gamma-synthase
MTLTPFDPAPRPSPTDPDGPTASEPTRDSTQGRLWAPRTRAVRAGIGEDGQFGAVIPPVHTSSTFSFEGFGRPRRFDYTRSGNPTRDLLERTLADLEGGAGAAAVATGMAGVTLLTHLVEPAELILCQHDVYGGTHRAFASLGRTGRVHVEFTDAFVTGDLDRLDDLEPKLVWLETPSNPLLRVVDVERICRWAHDRGARVVVDNTFLSPCLQQPLSLGADFALHSTTKFINGHSDVVGGAVVAANREDADSLQWWSNCLGLGQAPTDCAQVLRGLRTLDARWRLHEANANHLAERLQAHPAVVRVHYPGLPGHEHHDLARRQQQGFGAIVAFDLGTAERVQAFFEGLSVFTLAESLGGVESLASHPATMTHASMDPPARRRAGIGDGLVRLAVGIEDPEDLWHDLESALRAL